MAFARNGDVEIFYETFGRPDRPALLLVNGLGSQCINYRVEWCEQFVEAGHFVIRYDNRDVGLSSKFSDCAPDLARVAKALAAGEVPDVPYRVSDMAADGLAVLDDLGIEARARDGRVDGRDDRADDGDRASRASPHHDFRHVDDR